MVLSKQEEMRERHETLRNDLSVQRKVREQQGTTMHAFAQADAETPHGRFSQINTATAIGSNAGIASAYPACSPALAVQLPPEPPLGYRIDDLNPSDPVETSSCTQQEPGPTSDDAPSPIPLSDVQRAGVGSLSMAAQCMSQMSGADHSAPVRIERPPTFSRRKL
jgi:hypothetical protein